MTDALGQQAVTTHRGPTKSLTGVPGLEVRKAISVLKKRSGAHELTIREFQVTNSGIRVGEPLREFQGVLTGVPDYLGQRQPLFTVEGSGPGA